MPTILLIVVTTVAAALAVNAVLNGLVHSGRAPLTVGTFIVVGGGAYATSFVFEMVALAVAGKLPAANILWPCITWSLIAVSCLVVGAGRPVPFPARAAPFWLIGGLAMFSSLTNARPIVPGIALLLGGFLYAAVASPKAEPASQANKAGATPKVGARLAPSIGPYRLDIKVAGASHLIELSADESRAPNAIVAFKNERIYKAPPARFAGADWEIVLGTVDGRIYKISALLVLDSAGHRDSNWRSLEGQLRASLGAPASAAANIFAWDTDDGNVIMNRSDAGEAYVLAITLTSRAVSGFVRLR
jgi:hypothetical protein